MESDNNGGFQDFCGKWQVLLAAEQGWGGGGGEGEQGVGPRWLGWEQFSGLSG